MVSGNSSRRDGVFVENRYCPIGVGCHHRVSLSYKHVMPMVHLFGVKFAWDYLAETYVLRYGKFFAILIKK